MGTGASQSRQSPSDDGVALYSLPPISGVSARDVDEARQGMRRPSGIPNQRVVSPKAFLLCFCAVACLAVPSILVSLNVALTIPFVFLPLLAAMLACVRFGQLRPWPGLVVAVAFTVCFGAGLAAWVISGKQIPFFQRGPVPDSVVLAVIAGLSLITTAMVFGEFVTRNMRAARTAYIGRPVPQALVHVLVLAALVGAGMLVLQLGGWNAATGVLQPHDKKAIADIGSSVGLSLWSVFAVPAGVACGIGILNRSATKHSRATSLVYFACIAGTSILLMGSRLTITLVLLGVGAQHFLTSETSLRARHLVAGLGVVLLLSSYVYDQRGVSTTDDSLLETSLHAASYSLFDVSVASYLDRRDIEPDFANPSRIWTFSDAILPALGSGRVSLEDSRIDVITVKHIGSAAQAHNTGLPPSLPTFLLIVFGLGPAAVVALALGVLMALIARRIVRSQSPVAPLYYGLWVAFVFNLFKGGDILLDASSEVRRWVYILLIYGALRYLTNGVSSHESAAAPGV